MEYKSYIIKISNSNSLLKEFERKSRFYGGYHCETNPTYYTDSLKKYIIILYFNENMMRKFG